MEDKIVETMKEYAKGGGSVFSIFGENGHVECFVDGNRKELFEKLATTIFSNQEVRELVLAAMTTAQGKLNMTKSINDLSIQN